MAETALTHEPLAAASAAAGVLKAVLRDRVAGQSTLAQPFDHRRSALADRVQVPGGNHEQRDAIDAVVIEPVADQGAGLECRGLDAMQGDCDHPRRVTRRGHQAAFVAGISAIGPGTPSSARV